MKQAEKHYIVVNGEKTEVSQQVYYTKLQAALQERREDDGFHWEVILEMPSERINAAVTPALASGYAVTLQRLKILAHALPRTGGKP